MGYRQTSTCDGRGSARTFDRDHLTYSIPNFRGWAFLACPMAQNRDVSVPSGSGSTLPDGLGLYWVRTTVMFPVMVSPRGQSGLEANILASASVSASNIWLRPGVDLVVLLCNRAFCSKNRVKFGNIVNFSGNNLKSYVVNHYLVLFS